MNRIYGLAIALFCLLASCAAKQNIRIEQSGKVIVENDAAVLKPFYPNSLFAMGNKMVHLNKDYELLLIDTASGNISSYRLSADVEKSIRAKYSLIPSTDSLSSSYKFYAIAAGDPASFFVSLGLSYDVFDTTAEGTYKVVKYMSFIVKLDGNFNVLETYNLPEKELERLSCIYMISMPFGVKNDTLYTGVSSPSADSMKFMTDRYLLQSGSIRFIGHAPVARHPAYIAGNGCNYYFPNFTPLSSGMEYSDEKNLYRVSQADEIALVNNDTNRIMVTGHVANKGIVYVAYTFKSKDDTVRNVSIYYYDTAGKKSSLVKSIGSLKMVYSVYAMENTIYMVIAKGEKVHLEKFKIYAD